MTDDRWQQVDSVANVFLATINKRDTRSIRISCELKDDVDPDVLQQALDRTIDAEDQFQVHIMSGLFWHYIDHTDVRPMVKEENGELCPLLYHPQKEKELHYQVTWYKKRISFEAFHAICDGTGGMGFFNELLLNYFKLRYTDTFDQTLSLGDFSKEELEEDSFKKYREEEKSFFEPDRSQKENINTESFSHKHIDKAYHIKGRKLPHDQLQYFDIIIPVKEMLKKTKECNTTLTVYLAALLVMSILNDMPEKNREEPVNIAVPVNLRNYYPSHTARNFFIDIVLTHSYSGDETLNGLAEELNAQLKEKLVSESIHARMYYYQKLQENVIVRAVPLFMKNKGLRFLTQQGDLKVTAVISNLGALKLPDAMAEHIDHYCVYGSSENLFMAVSSFGEKLVVNFISPYANRGVIRDFVRSISGGIDGVKIFATEVIR